MQFISDLQYDFYWFISTFLVLCPTSTTITGNLRVKPLVEGIAAEWHRSPLHVYQLQPTSWTSLALCSPLCLDTQRECLLSQWRMADRSNRRPPPQLLASFTAPAHRSWYSTWVSAWKADASLPEHTRISYTAHLGEVMITSAVVMSSNHRNRNSAHLVVIKVGFFLSHVALERLRQSVAGVRCGGKEGTGGWRWRGGGSRAPDPGWYWPGQ